MLGFFRVCKNHFWFKTLYQYRLVVRGKFGGYMRASQKVFQNGVVKIHQWDLKINYYRLCPVTKYGVFSVRF
jgi:ribosomal protein S3